MHYSCLMNNVRGIGKKEKEKRMKMQTSNAYPNS